jgi:hypothetical protein
VCRWHPFRYHGVPLVLMFTLLPLNSMLRGLRTADNLLTSRSLGLADV